MNKKYGTIRLLLGPMYANKTTRLIEEAETLNNLGLKCIFVNHIDHARENIAGDRYVSTHHPNYRGISASIDRVLTDRLLDLNVEAYDAIFVDEGQFFDDIVEWATRCVFQDNKIVIVASLDGDAQMKPFGRVHDLESMCEQQNIVRLTAFCKSCLERNRLVNASFTVKLTANGPQKDVGGEEKYMAVCFNCHRERCK